MKTKEIIAAIKDQGEFDNFRNWSKKEIAEWVKTNFNCSAYVSTNVAFYLS